MTFSEIEELLDICRNNGVAKLELEGKIKLELFPFSAKIADLGGMSLENLTDSSTMSDEELLLMSAN